MQIAASGSHEALVFQALPETGVMAQGELMEVCGKATYAVGFSKAMKNKWVKTEKRDGTTYIVRVVDSITDTVAQLLRSLTAGETVNEADLKELKSRKLVLST